jgi:hypothetical protein
MRRRAGITMRKGKPGAIKYGGDELLLIPEGPRVLDFEGEPAWGFSERQRSSVGATSL